jgi:hypothetical protein
VEKRVQKVSFQSLDAPLVHMFLKARAVMRSGKRCAPVVQQGLSLGACVICKWCAGCRLAPTTSGFTLRVLGSCALGQRVCLLSLLWKSTSVKCMHHGAGLKCRCEPHLACPSTCAYVIHVAP